MTIKTSAGVTLLIGPAHDISYKQLLATTKAQLDANKALESAGRIEGIIDRLNPEIKLLKDYEQAQQDIYAAMELAPGKTALYQDALVKLGNEYEVNRSKATLWGQMTEGAIDRIDEAFATAWGNIGSGAESLWDNLKKGFKQTLGEIAHMLTTKPLLASISNWLTGTDNGQGVGSVWSKLLGGGGGGGASDSNGWGGMVSLGKNLYSAWSNLTGVGSSIASGYASGGIGGAIQGGAGYYGNMLSGIAGKLTTGFNTLASVFTGATAASTAATVASQGLTASALSGAVSQGAASLGAQFGTGVATTTAATYAAAEVGAAATAASIGGQISAAMSSAAAAWPLAVAMGMYQSGKLYDAGVRYKTSEVTNLDIVKYDPLAKSSLAGLGLTDKIASKVIGGKLAAIFSGSTFASAALGMLNSKLFGGSWQTKDVGFSLGVEGGEFEGRQFEYQKKKGGLFGKNKKRTRYSALDPETQAALDATYDATEGSVLDLFDRLNVELNDGVLDGLNIGAQKISTKDKTAEEIQAEIAKWFGGVADSMVSAVDAATAAGLGGYNFEGLTTFVNNLYSVNDSFDMLGLKLYDVSVSTGFMAEQLISMAGGLEALKAGESSFFENFYTDTEKADYALSTVNKQFEAMGVKLPGTRDAYRDMVEALDRTTESGRQMYIVLTGMSGSAAQAFDILESRTNALNESMMGAVTGAQGALQRAISAQQKKATEAYNATNTSLNDMVSTVTENVNGLNSVSSSLSTALKALRGDSDDAVKMLRAQAQATLQSALATARSGKSLSGFTGLEDALDTVSNNNTDLYGSMEDFARDQGRTANVVAELNGINGKQLTAAEKSLKGLEDQIKQAKDSYDLQMAQYDQQLEFAQAQMDALNGVDTSVMGVTAAINAMNAAVVAALSTLPSSGAGSAMQATPENNGTIVDTLYQSLFGRDADASGRDFWLAQLASGDSTYSNIADRMKEAAGAGDKAALAARGYATGGLISGPGTGTSDSIIARLSNGEYVMSADAVQMFGTGMLDQMNAGLIPAFATGGGVGETGPQLDITGPSRIFNANQTASMLKGGGGNNANLEQKVDVLIDVVKQIVGPMKLNSDADSKLFKKWDRVGLPTTAVGA